MLRVDRCALICDLAETYHIYDYRSLPATRVATFAVGLRNNSRIKSKMRGDDLKGNERIELILAGMRDMMMYLWTGRDDFPLLFDALMGDAEETAEKAQDLMVFNSPEEFDAMRNSLLEEEPKWN